MGNYYYKKDTEHNWKEMTELMVGAIETTCKLCNLIKESESCLDRLHVALTNNHPQTAIGIVQKFKDTLKNHELRGVIDECSNRKEQNED